MLSLVRTTSADDNLLQLSTVVASTYNISLSKAKSIVETANNLANVYPGFPGVKDIIALAGIESGMNHKANNGIAQGIMGINYSANGIKDPISARFDLHRNMQHGVRILHQYYTQLGHSKRRAIMAYNSGITAIKNGRTNPKYLRLYERELSKYRSITNEEINSNSVISDNRGSIFSGNIQPLDSTRSDVLCLDRHPTVFSGL